MVAYHNMPRCTLEEKLWLSLIKLRPCCVCAYPPVCQQTSPTQVHHLLIGGRRIGHFWVLPICADHHAIIWCYRHLEQRLWEKQNQEMGISREWPASKIVPRPI
jgi:hypothetical protein